MTHLPEEFGAAEDASRFDRIQPVGHCEAGIEPGEIEPAPWSGSGSGKSRAKGKFEPTRKHWWLSVILGPVITLISVIVAATALNVSHHDNERALAVAARNPLPDVRGAAGQPNSDLANPCSDSPDNVAGWGPARPVVGPSTFLNWPSFNSDSDNPAVGGDERNFVSIRENGSLQAWFNDIHVESGKTYMIRMYITNSAKDSDETVAVNTKVRIPLPSCKGKRIAINGFVSSTNAFPFEVWGGINLIADRPFQVAYVADSAMLTSNAFPKGLALPGTGFLAGDGGALVGLHSLDGTVRGGWENAMYFSMLVRVNMS